MSRLSLQQVLFNLLPFCFFSSSFFLSHFEAQHKQYRFILIFWFWFWLNNMPFRSRMEDIFSFNIWFLSQVNRLEIAFHGSDHLCKIIYSLWIDQLNVFNSNLQSVIGNHKYLLFFFCSNRQQWILNFDEFSMHPKVLNKNSHFQTCGNRWMNDSKIIFLF